MGAVVASMERHFYERLKHWLVKGLTTSQRTNKILEVFSDELAIKCSDFTSFEASLKHYLFSRVEARSFIEYGAKLEVPRDTQAVILCTLMSPQIYRGNGLEMIMEVMRASGDSHTALMNAMQQIVANLFCYWRAENRFNGVSVEDFLNREMSGEDAMRKIKMLVEGDDGLHCHSECEVIASDYADLGISADIQVRPSVYSSSFCGQVFSTSKVLFYDPIKFLLRLGWAPGRYHGSSQRRLDSLLAAKCLSYMCTFTQCPLIYPVAHAIFTKIGKRVTMKDIDAVTSSYHRAADDFMAFQQNIPEYDNDLQTKVEYCAIYSYLNPASIDQIS